MSGYCRYCDCETECDLHAKALALLAEISNLVETIIKKLGVGYPARRGGHVTGITLGFDDVRKLIITLGFDDAKKLIERLERFNRLANSLYKKGGRQWFDVINN